MKTYNFKKEALEKIQRKVIVEQLNAKLRHDIELGCSEYRSLYKDYMDILQSQFPMDLKLHMLKDKIRELKVIRELSDKSSQTLPRPSRPSPDKNTHLFSIRKSCCLIPSYPWNLWNI